MSSPNNLKKIKSDYFLQKIFDMMNLQKKLKIIKINKNIQKRTNININDYKKYSETYSSIEIEIIINNIIDKEYFIRFKEENKKFFHIYFNDSGEEKKNYLVHKESNKKIKIIIDHQFKSFRGLFYNCDNIDSINFKKFYRNNITCMSGMFLIVIH